jgi:hypothetical protein
MYQQMSISKKTSSSGAKVNSAKHHGAVIGGIKAVPLLCSITKISGAQSDFESDLHGMIPTSCAAESYLLCWYE